jgi:membrane-bound acyltransferase YfiQ involved in biofilm formation
MAATDLLELGADAHPAHPAHPDRHGSRSAHRRRSEGLLPDAGHDGYLEMFNLFRVIACAAVLAQHSFIWTNMEGNFVGTGFITILHLSRTSFFFLTALVVTYAQIDHPRSTGDLWRRRYTLVGVPYLAWTGIYLVFSLITVTASWDEVGAFLRHNVLLGFSQMYFVIVIFQFYLFFPLLMKLLRAVDHRWILAGSLAFATLIGLFLHYPSWFSPLSGANQTINQSFPWGRNILVYQEFIVAGMLVAWHFDEVIGFVSRHYRRILLVSGATGVLMVLWYMISVWSGSSVERASDIYEPQAALWCLAAIAGVFALSWWWHQGTAGSHMFGARRRLPSVAYLAGLTGGIFFAHTIFINLLRSALDSSGLAAHLPWYANVAILFVATVASTGAFVALVLRTPLRWVLGGPVRSEERASYARRRAATAPVAVPK